jgi:hypothetical protein
MFEARRDHRFANESCLADVVALKELLDGDVTPQLEVVGAVDATKAATPVLTEHAVAAAVPDLRRRDGMRVDRRTARCVPGD